MEDSLQLPQDIDIVQNLQNFLSPGSIHPQSRENSPPHSLAYSNSTVGKDKLKEFAFKSPIAFQSTLKAKQLSPFKHGIVKNSSQNFINNQYIISESPIKNNQQDNIQPIKQQNMIVKGKYKRINPKQKTNNSKSPPKSIHENSKVQPKNEQIKHAIKKSKIVPQYKPIQLQKQDLDPNERKTLQKGELLRLKKRIKQLQQALNIQTVISQQLRTKLSTTNNLLQSKLKQNNIQYILSCKNTSRDLSNIDIFVEMNQLHKLLTQKNIIIDRYQTQIKQYQLQISKKTNKKTFSPSSSSLKKSPNKQLYQQIQNLTQQRQSLMTYIDQQKQTLKRKIQYIVELQAQINRLGDKNDHYTNIQRPKIIKELAQYRNGHGDIKRQLQEKQIQFNFIQLGLKEEKIQLQNKIKLLNQEKIQRDQIFNQMQRLKQIKNQSKQVQMQVYDEEKEILLKETNLLKNQRDYYLNQYRKKISDSSKLYALQLKLAALQNQKDIEL